MTPAFKALLLTMAYQRQTELQVALQQLGQAFQMTQDPNEKAFLQQQSQQMEFMLKELTEAIQRADAEGQ